jgi:flavin reductase (DIM6/NTAB) family NADH-FMN oxidoreductase RutF
MHIHAIGSAAVVPSAIFKQTMRATAASVNIITCEHEGSHYGLTATAFSSVSTDPATVLICVNAGASACEYIRASGHFCVNVLVSGMQELATAFAGALAPERRFGSGTWRQLASGNMALDGCAAVFDCEVGAMFQEGSHWIVLGRVVACGSQPLPPLVYADGKYGSFQMA